MTEDDQGFIAPAYQRPTPTAVRLAGRRLHAYATEHQVPRDVPILDMLLIGESDEVRSLARDQRFLSWWLEQSPMP